LAIRFDIGPGYHGPGTEIGSEVCSYRSRRPPSLPISVSFTRFPNSREVGRSDAKMGLGRSVFAAKRGVMSRVPNFSIIIPTHNRLDFLKQALNSIWGQTADDYEIIIVNDGSTDGTEEWLDAQRKRVRTFTQANRGPGAARNVGAQEARGEYVAFLDS